MLRLFVKRTTKVSHYDRKKDRAVFNTLHEGTYIEAEFSMCQGPIGENKIATIFVTKVVGGNDKLVMDYHWITAADFNWYVSIPVKVE
jgi:hypothetical protein